MSLFLSESAACGLACCDICATPLSARDFLGDERIRAMTMINSSRREK
jgi:hypothetical protein